ncbi:Thiamine pyrophosphokinase 1 [Nymphon striatum]|nr:Thiamine pyrophosphokinase 1 [Nymphon striatum]
MPSSSIVASTRREISRSAIFANISASGVGGSAPKYRSSEARPRKYSAIAFIVLKESSNPSSVHEKVPYETVRILLPIVSSPRLITLIGGADLAPSILTVALKWGETVVCADGGADSALWAEVDPVAVIGDMDSISDAAKDAFGDVLHPIAEQDSTDFDKALRHIDAPLVLGVGFSGARLDHELGSMTVLVRHPDRRCILIGEDTIVLLCPPEIALDIPKGTPVSLYPMADVGCDSDGLHWDTAGLRFAPDARVGTLNKATGPVTLRPDAPKMLLILPRAMLGITIEALAASDATWPARVG